MKGNWTLFWCLEPAAQAALMQYQWQNYGTKLDIATPPTQGVRVTGELENSSEIDRLIRQPPSRSRGRDG